MTILNDDLFTARDEGATDASGEILFADLPAGTYSVRVSASGHQDSIERVRVRPGMTVSEDIFVMNDVVTIEWSIREVALEDRYELVLTAVYETEVPVAVLVLEPASVTFPPMRKGDVRFGELTLTNYGLIRAEEVEFHPPRGSEAVRYDFLATIPETLDPGQRVKIPYRAVALRDTSTETEGSASGGGGACSGADMAVVRGASRCINGVLVYVEAKTVFVSTTDVPCLRRVLSGTASGEPCCYLLEGSAACAKCTDSRFVPWIWPCRWDCPTCPSSYAENGPAQGGSADGRSNLGGGDRGDDVF